MSQTNVFANGLEIACQASDGKSSAAFPDPCWSPPAPKAGWIVVPYANTAYAKDTTNASKTVFIRNRPVMLKDHSYFKTSTGNEGAASSLGLVSGVKQGKAYFASWSMDVKIEGRNVCRHTDLMTHNHGSVPGNTGAWHYLSEKSQGQCEDAIKEITHTCRVSDKEQKAFIESQEKRNKKRKKRNKKPLDVRPKTWKDEHCTGLLFKPQADLLTNRLQELEADAKALYGDLAGEAWDAVKDRAAEKAKAYGARTAGKHVAGLAASWTGPGELLVQGVIVVTDLIDGIVSLVSLPFNLYGAYSNVADVRALLEDIPKKLKELEAIQGDNDQKQALTKKLTEQARTVANNNDCVRARKCMLVPYTSDATQGDTGSIKVGGKTYQERSKKASNGDFFTKLGLGTSSGCCPGQTGHHLIPDSWVQQANCQNYNHNKAPVVCVEGVTQNDGTHESVHYNLNQLLKKRVRKKTKSGKDSTTFTQAEVIAMATESHTKTFPKSGDCRICIGPHPCDKACIKAQLEAYYQCDTFKPKPIHQKKINNGTSRN